MSQETEIHEEGVSKPSLEIPRAEVSASTIGRMMGLATTAELKLVEGKLDLIATKVANLTTRMDKVLSILGTTPTGADLERIDVQIGSLKSLIKDVLAGGVSEGSEK